jgi:WD40 repeat protein
MRLTDAQGKDIVGLLYSPQGTYLAALNATDNDIYIWKKYEFGTRLTLGNNPADVIAFSPDESLLAAVCNAENAVYLFDLNAGGSLKSILNLSVQPYGIAFSPDNSSLAYVDGSDTIFDFSLINRVEHKLTYFENESLQSVAYSPDGKLVAAGGTNGALVVWNMLTMKPLNIPRNHTGTVLSLSFSADGKLLASGGDDGYTWVWEIK